MRRSHICCMKNAYVKVEFILPKSIMKFLGKADLFIAGYLFFLVFAAVKSTGAVTITEITDDLPVTVSHGAHISAIDDVLLYTEMEYLWFTILDLPDPPAFSPGKCTYENEDDEACSLFKGLQGGVEDITSLLEVINRVLTTKGLSSTIPKGITVPDSWLKIVANVNVASNLPTPDMISKAGNSWFSDMEARLVLRKLLSDGNPKLSIRERRWLNHVMKPALKLAQLVGMKEINKNFNSVFVGDKSILSILTNYKIVSKDHYSVFADLPSKVSEFQFETKRLFLEVLNKTHTVKELANEIQKEIQNHSYKLATIEEAFLLEQSTIADIVKSIYTSVVYGMHFQAFDECYSAHIPVAFVPPALLQERLQEVQSKLPSHLRFSIPLAEYQQYYRLELTQCLFDSAGGLIRLGVPLIEKNSNMQMFSFKALPFAHGDTTCSIETPASFIIKDFKENKIYAVSEVDEDYCHPHTSKLCRIPYGTADDSINICAAALLSGEPASVIKMTCQLKCFADSRTSVSQLDDTSFIGLHLPTDGVRLECPNQVIELKTPVMHGAVRFQGSCGCRVVVGNRTLGATKTKSCDGSEKSGMDIILPIQMTKFSDYLPFSDGVNDKTVFSHADEIFDSQFNPFHAPENDESHLPFQMSTVFWNVVQSIVIFYIYQRLNAVTAMAIATANNIQMVRAGSKHKCELPDDAYFMLIAIIVLCLAILLPSFVEKVYNVISSAYKDHVEMVARKITMDEL